MEWARARARARGSSLVSFVGEERHRARARARGRQMAADVCTLINSLIVHNVMNTEWG